MELNYNKHVKILLKDRKYLKTKKIVLLQIFLHNLTNKTMFRGVDSGDILDHDVYTGDKKNTIFVHKSLK